MKAAVTGCEWKERHRLEPMQSWRSTCRAATGNAMTFDTGDDDVITVNMVELVTEAKDLARMAFEAWSAVTGLEFRYTEEEERRYRN